MIVLHTFVVRVTSDATTTRP